MMKFMISMLVASFSAVDACSSWCNAYTCSLATCSDCTTCSALSAGEYCAGWCNSFTCGSSYCSGCDICYVPPKKPLGTWYVEATAGKGMWEGVPLSPFFKNTAWEYFKFEITMNETVVTSRTWIKWFGQPLAGPFISMDRQPTFYGTSKSAPGGIVAGFFTIAIPPKAPGLFPDLTTGLHLCYDDFFNVQNFYAIKNAFFTWEYLPDTDEFQYKTNPVFYCPSTPLDDNNLYGGTGPWANPNPIMLDPFIKSFYIMGGKYFPKLTKGTVPEELYDMFPKGLPK